MEPDGNPAEPAEVGGELDLSPRNDMMPGQRSGQDDIASLQRVASLDHVL